MQRLRTTFKRSRTPTGAEMKTQSSLEVPKQVRSASFDEIQLEAKRNQVQDDEKGMLFGGLLRVPHFNSQRSRSVDSGGSEDSVTYLEVPRRFQRRRSSSTRSPVCVHCNLLEEYLKRQTSTTDDESGETGVSRSFSFSSDTSSGSEREEREIPECNITVTLSDTAPELPPPPPSPIDLVPNTTMDICNFSSAMQLVPNSMSELLPSSFSRLIPNSVMELIPKFTTEIDEVPPLLDEVPPSPRERRRSIQRQEAFFAEPTGNSLDNVSDNSSEVISEVTTSDGIHSEGDGAACGGAPGLSVRDIYLTVPELKRDRAVSVDSCFSKMSSSGKTEELQHSGVSLEVPVSPNVTLRSRSVDIVLPTNEQARYKALAMTNATAPDTHGITPTNAALLKGYVRIDTIPHDLL